MVYIIVPSPIAVSVTSDPPGNVAIGSNIILSCNVELSPAVDVPVTVNTEWTGPAAFVTTNTAQPSSVGSTTTYTSRAVVSSFGRDQSGSYNCTATVSSESPLLLVDNSAVSALGHVTVGKKIQLLCDCTKLCTNELKHTHN